jgi:hypothetical protein
VGQRRDFTRQPIGHEQPPAGTRRPGRSGLGPEHERATVEGQHPLGLEHVCRVAADADQQLEVGRRGRDDRHARQ